jgi:hypothetical protein
MNKGTPMQEHTGNVLLAAATSTGLVNFLAQADLIVSIFVGCLSAVGIIYSIIWHRVRIKQTRKKDDE